MMFIKRNMQINEIEKFQIKNTKNVSHVPWKPKIVKKKEKTKTREEINKIGTKQNVKD
jgi:hypothetical protein